MRTTSRLAVIAAAGSLIATVLVATPAQAAVADSSPAGQAASWITKQDFFNAGARVDVLQQLAALGDTSGVAAQLTEIKSGAVAYATTAEAEAKLIFAGDLVDQDANGWGAGDLQAKVADGVDDTTGRIDGDYVTPASQALAVRALGDFNGRSEHSNYTAARDFLLSQQCADGRYRDALASTSCDADAPSGSPDATAFVVLYLTGSTDPAIQTSLTKAQQWLREDQRADGSWKSVDQSWGAGVPNANSTGLAALALGLGSPQSVKAAAWLRGVQARDAGRCATKLSTDKGAIAFTPADYGYGRTGGLDEGSYTRSSWVYATQQSLAVLEDVPAAAGALSLRGPTRYLRPGARVQLTAGHVAPVSQACLTGPGTKQGWIAGATGSSVRTVVTPRGTANRVYRVTDSADRTQSHALHVLDRKRFDIRKDRSRVKRGKYQHVLISGLAPRERINVYYKGKRIRHTFASATGVYATKFRVGRGTGMKKLVVKGQFGDLRYAVRYFRVVR